MSEVIAHTQHMQLGKIENHWNIPVMSCVALLQSNAVGIGAACG